jgi:hypothetical protein
MYTPGPSVRSDGSDSDVFTWVWQCSIKLNQLMQIQQSILGINNCWPTPRWKPARFHTWPLVSSFPLQWGKYVPQYLKHGGFTGHLCQSPDKTAKSQSPKNRAPSNLRKKHVKSTKIIKNTFLATGLPELLVKKIFNHCVCIRNPATLSSFTINVATLREGCHQLGHVVKLEKWKNTSSLSGRKLT